MEDTVPSVDDDPLETTHMECLAFPHAKDNPYFGSHTIVANRVQSLLTPILKYHRFEHKKNVKFNVCGRDDTQRYVKYIPENSLDIMSTFCYQICYTNFTIVGFEPYRDYIDYFCFEYGGYRVGCNYLALEDVTNKILQGGIIPRETLFFPSNFTLAVLVVLKKDVSLEIQKTIFANVSVSYDVFETPYASEFYSLRRYGFGWSHFHIETAQYPFVSIQSYDLNEVFNPDQPEYSYKPGVATMVVKFKPGTERCIRISHLQFLPSDQYVYPETTKQQEVSFVDKFVCYQDIVFDQVYETIGDYCVFRMIDCLGYPQGLIMSLNVSNTFDILECYVYRIVCRRFRSWMNHTANMTHTPSTDKSYSNPYMTFDMKYYPILEHVYDCIRKYCKSIPEAVRGFRKRMFFTERFDAEVYEKFYKNTCFICNNPTPTTPTRTCSNCNSIISGGDWHDLHHRIQFDDDRVIACRYIFCIIEAIYLIQRFYHKYIEFRPGNSGFRRVQASFIGACKQQTNTNQNTMTLRISGKKRKI
jgi:hypothetical protein